MEQQPESDNTPWQLLINAPDAVIIIDAAGKVIFWNPKAETVFGWTIKEALGRHLTETIIPVKYREAHNKGMKRFLATGEAHVLNKTIEITALNKTGREFYVSLTISQTELYGNIAFIAFIRDITEKKENELLLYQQSKDLQRSNRELEQFAHVASHDMKEPIRKIEVFTGMLRTKLGQSLTSEAGFYIQKIQDAALRLNDLVEGVLKYSVVKSADEPFETIDLEKILQKIESDLELLILDKKATIKYGDLPEFEGVPFLIYQLFYNLLNNSLKFSKKEVGPFIEISAEVKSDIEPPLSSDSGHGKYVEITVTDNGIGFDQSDAEKIFLPFTRLNSHDRYTGTGLGLALCKNIVERHQGILSAVSNEESTCFKVTIPQKRVLPAGS